MLKVNLGNTSRAWASNSEVPVLESIAGYAVLAWFTEKTRLAQSPPTGSCLCHCTYNNISTCWPILTKFKTSTELQNNSGWMSPTAEVSKGKLILTVLNHKMIRVGWDLKRSSGSTSEVSKSKCIFYKFQKNLPLSYTYIYSLCFLSTKTHIPILIQL